MKGVDVGAWNANWAWSLPLIVLNVVIQVIGLVPCGICHTSFCPTCLIFRQRRRGECATFWFTIMTA